MRRPTWTDLSRSGSSNVAVLILLLFVLAFVAVFGVGWSDSSIEFGREVSPRQLRSLPLGATRDDVERTLGSGNYGDLVQLCFRDDKLASKRSVPATPGAQVVGVARPRG